MSPATLHLLRHDLDGGASAAARMGGAVPAAAANRELIASPASAIPKDTDTGIGHEAAAAAAISCAPSKIIVIAT